MIGIVLGLFTRQGVLGLLSFARRNWRLVIAAALVAGWYFERAAYGGKQYEAGRDDLQAEIDHATDKLNRRIAELEAEIEVVEIELDRERVAAGALERRLDDLARSDPLAGSSGLGRDSRLRIEQTR